MATLNYRIAAGLLWRTHDGHAQNIPIPAIPGCDERVCIAHAIICDLRYGDRIAKVARLNLAAFIGRKIARYKHWSISGIEARNVIHIVRESRLIPAGT